MERIPSQSMCYQFLWQILNVDQVQAKISDYQDNPKPLQWKRGKQAALIAFDYQWNKSN